MLTPEALISWGWRIPFILGLLVGLLGAYLRWGLDDTPKFTEIEERGEGRKFAADRSGHALSARDPDGIRAHAA